MGCRPRANMATASVVLHVFTTLNTLSSAKTQHANEQRSTRASQSHTVQVEGASSASGTEGGAARRFPFSVAAHFHPWTVRVFYGKIRSPEVCGVTVPTPGERVPVPRRGRACGGRRSRVPTGAAVRLPSHWKRRHRPPRVPTRASEWRDDDVLHEEPDVEGALVEGAGDERGGRARHVWWCSRGPTRASE